MDSSEESSGWPYRPTREKIRNESERIEYGAGVKIYEGGDVRFIDMSRGEILAVVRGEHRMEAVHMSHDPYAFRCSCWRFHRMSGNCRHIIGVLLYMAYHMDDLEDAEQVRLDSADVLLDKVPPQDLKRFVAGYLRNDPVMYDDFVKQFKLSGVSAPPNYEQLLKNMREKYHSHTGGMLRFGRLFKKIRQRRDVGEYAETTSAYKTLLEALSTFDVDDDPVYYADCLRAALDGMADSLAREDMPHNKKREHIQYLFNMCLDESNSDYWPDCRRALEAVCDTPADLEYWESLVAQYSNRAEPMASNMLHMQAHILHTAGSVRAALDLLSKHYTRDRELCLKYVRLLRGADPARARRAGKGILKAYQDDIDILKDLLHLYDDSGPVYVRILRRIFMNTGEWEYFFMLKKASDDWEGTLKGISEDMQASNMYERAVDMYLKDGLHPQAMDVVVAAHDVAMYEKYASKLAKLYPEQYVDSYGNAVRDFVPMRMARDHYYAVRRHLERIERMAGKKKFRALVDGIKKEHVKKPVLQSVLRDL